MKTSKYRGRCHVCRKRTDHAQKIGNLVGVGNDAYQIVERRCLTCGNVVRAEWYPDLLADFFSIPCTPTTKKDHYDETD
jgi:hypothetical protein